MSNCIDIYFFFCNNNGHTSAMNKKGYDKYRIKTCRICSSELISEFLSLGSMPIPNGFLSKKELKKSEPFYPLAVCVCEKCWLVQLTHVVPAEIMFKNYLYIPSTSTTMLNHFKKFAEDTVSNFSLTDKDLVVDIGSNDGSLLGYFKEHEINVLGIDPASNLAQVARLKGINTIDDFFTEKLAKRIVKDSGKAKIISATNVVAHINDLHNLISGIKILLEKNGVFVMEFPYLADLLEKNEFDTIYHEHLSYFSIRPLIELFKQHSMHIFHIKRLTVHGGSVRVFVANEKSTFRINQSVQKFVKEELLRKLNTKDAYADFGRRVSVIKRDLKTYLKKIKLQGKTIVGYGASAKGNVLLNYCKIGTDLLDYIVDSILYKHGRYTPGTHIPIFPEIRLQKDVPHYALILAWNFAGEIIRKQTKYRKKGGQFIITIPYLRII